MTTASPMGRYDVAGEGEPLQDVRLLSLPVQLLVAAREHHDELLHELALLALGDPVGRPEVPTRLLELIEELGVRYGSAADRPDELVDAAVARGEDTVDLSYRVPPHVVDAADTLERLLAEADELCRSEELLTVPRPPLLREFSTWYCGELRRQVGGEAPQPWAGPLELETRA